jgi:streptogramin lyase
MADNAIHEVNPDTGAVREVIKGKLATPRSIAVASGTGDEIYVADVFAFRKVDGKSGAVTDIARSHAANTPIAYANSVTANDRHIVLTNSNGTVQRYDRRTLRRLQEWPMRGAQTAIELRDGSILVAGSPRGTITRLSGPKGEQRKTLLSDMSGPLAFALSPSGEVYVSQAESGEIVRLDLTYGMKRVVARELRMPQGLAFGTDGSLFVIERDARQLTRIDPRTGATQAVATNLPVGRRGVDNASAGVAAGARGTLYVMSDVENSIYRLTPRR